MAEPDRLLPSAQRSSFYFAAGAVVAATAAGLFGGGLALGRVLTLAASPPAERDRCGLPAGIELGQLSDGDRGHVARWALLCSDHERGRITAAEYRAGRLALEAPVPPTPPTPIEIPPAPPLGVEPVWAARVQAMSSQYDTDSWSANKVLGPPDAASEGGDDVNAWASEGEDDRVEFLEVAFDWPRHLSGVDVLETYNPGAVTAVELLTVTGGRLTVYRGAAAALAQPTLRRRVEFACTDEAVVGVRVTLDSRAVPGWNEIDAIGGRPCQ